VRNVTVELRNNEIGDFFDVDDLLDCIGAIEFMQHGKNCIEVHVLDDVGGEGGLAIFEFVHEFLSEGLHVLSIEHGEDQEALTSVFGEFVCFDGVFVLNFRDFSFQFVLGAQTKLLEMPVRRTV